MPNEFVIRNGFISKGNSIVEGGFTATTISASTYSNLPSPSITVGTSQLTSGTDTRVLFQSGTTLQQDGNFTFDPTLKRLTLRAVGTAATDIPFAVQNSGGTRNNLTVNGAGLTTSNIDAPGSYVWTNHFQAVRFESGSPITNVNIKTNWPFVESFYIGRSTGTANNDASTASGFMYSHNGEFTVRNGQTGGYYGITLNCEQNLEQRVGIDTGRTGFGLGWSLRNFTNSVDVINFQTNSPRVGIGWNNKGAALGAILDVKAQGALSTDIAFRVRNNGDSNNIVNFNGNGQFTIGLGASVNSTTLPEYSVVIGHNASDGAAGNRTASVAIGRLASGNYYGVAIGTQSTSSGDAGVAIGASATAGANGSALGYQATAAGAGVSIGKLATSTSQGAITIGTNTINNQNYSIVFNSSLQVITNEHSNVCKMYFNSTKQSFFYHENGRFVINSKVDLVANTNYDNSATNTITITTGTTPTLNIVDSFQLYSADITAGNAAPHFRTENGSIIKLYQNANTVAIDDNLINLGVRASGGTSTFTNPVSVGSFSATTGTINGNLTITGDTTMPNRSAFSVYGAGTTNNLTTTQNGDGTLNTNNFGLTYSQGTGFDISTGIFTAPIAGLYQVTLIGRNSGFAGGISQLAVIRNNSNASGNVMMIEWAASSSMNHTGGGQIFRLAVGDTLRLKVLAGQINFDGNDNWSVAYIG